MSSGFVTESEAADIRKRRQEEWERVRKADDPIERPEEPYDNRSLYDRLQEQKQKKDMEYEEAHKLKNMIKGLDDDEIEFLDLVDRTKLAADRRKELEEEKELNDYRNRVAMLQEQSIGERLQSEIVVSKPKTVTVSHTSQQKLLKGVVVVKKRKIEQEPKMGESVKKPNVVGEGEGDRQSPQVTADQSALKCVAILPGLGVYEDSSTEENSSDSDSESIAHKTDLLGRIIVVTKKTEKKSC